MRPMHLTALLLIGSFFVALKALPFEVPGSFSYIGRSVDADINGFLIGVINNFREEMKNGIPDLKIPVLDPLRESKLIRLDVEEDKASVHANFTELEITGLSNFELEHLDANLSELSLRFQLRLPWIKATGKYVLDGTIIKIIPLRGNGSFLVESDNLTLSAHASMVKEKVDDTEKLRLQLNRDFDVDIDFDAVHLDLENFLGGGKWTEILLDIINDLSKSLFKKFLPLLKGELNKSLLKVINKQLKKLPLTIIVPGSSADDFVDEILQNVRNFIQKNNYDPMSLPDFVSNFSKKVMFVTTYGEAKLYDGWLTGISTIHRTDHCEFDANDTAISVSANMGLKNLHLKYSGKATFMSWGPSIECGGKIDEVDFYFTVEQSNKKGSKPHLKELDITKMSTIWIELSGLGPLTWIMKYMLTGISKLIEGFITEKVTSELQEYFEEEVQKVALPI